jgi:hypothetical protein
MPIHSVQGSKRLSHVAKIKVAFNLNEFVYCYFGEMFVCILYSTTLEFYKRFPTVHIFMLILFVDTYF